MKGRQSVFGITQLNEILRQSVATAIVLLGGVFLCFSHQSAAEEISPSGIRFEVTEVSSDGKVATSSWKHKVELGWVTDKEKRFPPRLSPRLWLAVPKDVSLKAVVNKSMPNILKTRQSPFEDHDGETLAADLVQSNESLTLRIRKKGSERDIEVGFLIRHVVQDLTVMIHPSCESQGIDEIEKINPDLSGAGKKSKKQKRTVQIRGYVGVSCGLIKNNRVLLMVSHGKSVKVSGVTGFNPRTKGKDWELYEAGLKTAQAGKSTGIASWSIESVAAASGQRKLHLGYEARGAPLGFSVGVSGTGLYYSEVGPYLSAKSRQAGMTLKASGAFGIIRDRLWVRLSAYANIFMLPVASTPPTARFWGINPTLQYIVPGSFLAGSWSFVSGAYIWGMIVNPDSNYPKGYGVVFNSGPVLQIGYRKDPIKESPFSMYLKYAPTAPLLSLAPFNSEFAAGMSVPIVRPLKGPVWSLSFDFSRLGIYIENKTNKTELTTFSLGLGLDF